MSAASSAKALAAAALKKAARPAARPEFLWGQGGAKAMMTFDGKLAVIEYSGPLTLGSWRRVADVADMVTPGLATVVEDFSRALMTISEAELRGPARSALLRPSLSCWAVVPKSHIAMYRRRDWSLAQVGIEHLSFASMAEAIVCAADEGVSLRPAGLSRLSGVAP